MDDVFAGLLEQGQNDLKRAQEDEQQAERERYAYKMARLREALGITAAEDPLWESLAPGHYGSGYIVHAYGVSGRIYDNLSGWLGDAIPGKVTRESLARFVVYARNVRAQVKARVLHELQGADINAYRTEQQRASVADGLWDDPEVLAARIAFLKRTRITDITTAPDFWWYNAWLQAAALLPLDAERAEVLSLRERATAWHDLQWRLTMAEGDVLDEEVLTAWRAEVATFGDDAPQRWYELLERLAHGLSTARAEEAWQRERAQLEAAAFFPFRYYAVGYGYLTCDERGTVVEADIIPTLHLPDAEGWIVDERNGSRVQVRAIATVTETHIQEVWQLPTWPSCWRGEGHRRYQTPPAGAERL